ncbi:hypothetical protein DAPPUDRAFT_316073 [Daphnia pulex]|uniref:Uncharacterized protein n=1 Tax=Daphnia pulex TaxID=6669 RepID=E9GBM4_DAPPU|nr:hypothetical protein DAPPUDRAFT_316073 [Daphnia pulex]|eukprot:EFX83130.1 hypothetical protein DAPPUDRAFT_316073 [Daphnia pulex]
MEPKDVIPQPVAVASEVDHVSQSAEINESSEIKVEESKSEEIVHVRVGSQGFCHQLLLKTGSIVADLVNPATNKKEKISSGTKNITRQLFNFVLC